MVQPTERMVALAERGLAYQYRAAHITGCAEPAEDGPLRIYTDGSVSGQRIAGGIGWITGWGYLTTRGHWGCGKVPQFDRGRGFHPSTVATISELRALWHGIRSRLADEPITVITDSRAAAQLLTDWCGGSTTMPPGYVGKTRRGIPTLERLRAHVAEHAGNLTVETVKGHAGDVLNEAADTLALIGMRWARDNLTKVQARERGQAAAEGFLAQWRRR